MKEDKEMTIFELAAELGKALKKDEKLVRLENAKKKYENEPDLQKMLVEYEVQQKALQVEITREERDTMFIDVIQKRINELYDAVMSHPVFIELNDAQAEVNELMNAVNNTITFEITGELPSCTHDCSTCGGGCSH
ncbi:MAG: YlbF family regulator [Ruminococcaceae bacterium]|nr:YlbF family regulator [Oscillospiraceae bacterium]